jgi:cell filamentation protein
MTEFETGPLQEYTPCVFKSMDEVIEALAVVHVELVLIHPFREGNGRMARLLSILMAAQAELPILDFGLLKGEKREHYFTAVRAGLNKNYEPMRGVFESIISRTLRIHS